MYEPDPHVEALPIQVLEDRIAFPWFKLHEDKGEIAAYTQFIAALCQTAKEKKRVTARAQETFENEKFALRVWLIGLGMIGKEYGVALKLLVNNRLTGNGSWRYGTPEKAAPAPVGAPEALLAELEELPAEAEALAEEPAAPVAEETEVGGEAE